MDVDTKIVGKVLIVTPLEKQIDASVAMAFKGKMIDLIHSNNRHILLDLSRVEFIGSSGLGVVVSGLKTLGGEGDFVICNILKPVMSLFKLTRMDRVFRIYPSQEEALKAFTR